MALAANVKDAAATTGVSVDIEKVTDIVDISKYCVMATPGLVVNEKVVSTGKVLSTKEIGEYLLKVIAIRAR